MLPTLPLLLAVNRNQTCFYALTIPLPWFLPSILWFSLSSTAIKPVFTPWKFPSLGSSLHASAISCHQQWPSRSYMLPSPAINTMPFTHVSTISSPFSCSLCTSVVSQPPMLSVSMPQQFPSLSSFHSGLPTPSMMALSQLCTCINSNPCNARRCLAS